MARLVIAEIYEERFAEILPDALVIRDRELRRFAFIGAEGWSAEGGLQREDIRIPQLLPEANARSPLLAALDGEVAVAVVEEWADLAEDVREFTAGVREVLRMAAVDEAVLLLGVTMEVTEHHELAGESKCRYHALRCTDGRVQDLGRELPASVQVAPR